MSIVPIIRFGGLVGSPSQNNNPSNYFQQGCSGSQANKHNDISRPPLLSSLQHVHAFEHI
uniref:Uncharacterized protein MANES_13G053200 n=1 Tax=Rhizophora mucronata TaxID=61149 RepID=A0A2P2QS29_RHIMU